MRWLTLLDTASFEMSSKAHLSLQPQATATARAATTATTANHKMNNNNEAALKAALCARLVMSTHMTR